jgi:hypothetical protein
MAAAPTLQSGNGWRFGLGFGGSVMVFLILAALAGPPVAAAEPGDYRVHFQAADSQAKQESRAVRRDYRKATRLFDRGKQVPVALSELNYLGYDGSVAAAIRLCAIYAYGVRNEVNLGAGLHWCSRASRAGYAPAGPIVQYLFDRCWQDVEDEEP